MKSLAIIMCFYINLLAVIPTVKVIGMTMEHKCHDTCCGKAHEETPNGCQKEKCLVNLNFNSGIFLVFDNGYEFQNTFSDLTISKNTYYNTTLIPNFNVAIWQPPEYS